EQYVYPIHRLDRKTSGLLLFALDAPTAAAIQNAIIQQEIHKEYLAIVRGYFPESILVDHPLQNDRMKTQEAVTAFQLLQTTELPIPFGKHATSRYSLIRAFPKTGRMHQIRKHCNHLRHPIIGDRPHGCNKQNKLFKEKWNMTQMLLHAHKMKLTHPASKRELVLEAAPSDIFQKSLDLLKLRL
ncbi:MAG: pseudouridine synthase, partial [Bacteroidota bacterium]